MVHYPRFGLVAEDPHGSFSQVGLVAEDPRGSLFQVRFGSGGSMWYIIPGLIWFWRIHVVHYPRFGLAWKDPCGFIIPDSVRSGGFMRFIIPDGLVWKVWCGPSSKAWLVLQDPWGFIISGWFSFRGFNWFSSFQI